MLWKAIALIICDRTRPPHQLNDEYYTFTPNTSNYYLLMTDRSKQIIPDSQAVVSCFDPEILKILDSHSTFTINELLKTIKIAGLDRTSFRDELRELIVLLQKEGHSVPSLFSKLMTFIDGDKINESRYTSYEILRKALLNGTECSLLQTDDKGWQKGKLKICFEFTPDESEPVTTQDKSPEIQLSPLDEIRNSLVESN